MRALFLGYSLDKDISLGNGGLHLLDKRRNVLLDRYQLALQGGNGLGVEVMFQKEDLVLEG